MSKQLEMQENLDVRELLRLRISARGAVQGVGFRPFIFRLATELGLDGWVSNSPQGVRIEVEGNKEQLDSFLLRIGREIPPHSFIQSLESSFLAPLGYKGFEIQESDQTGGRATIVLPDIAVCEACLKEILDPTNRRYQYPFTNCTHCGPRYSIIEALPYDRPNTTMRQFTMCEQCRSEYEDPADRRFHAQPNACACCGPHLELWRGEGAARASHREALAKAAEALHRGQIVAVKGLGGFHLLVDARQEKAVTELRQRKHREEKPFALMFPSLDRVQRFCEVSPMERRLLNSPESPIVLLKRKQEPSFQPWTISPAVAPDNPYLGVMLPYTPLHHLLMMQLGIPVVATSGNRSDETICIDEHEALERLNGIADLFLVHNRPIARPVDDSVVRVMMGREMVLRRARGYAPLPIAAKKATAPVLAVGAHLKNTIAASIGSNIFVSQHIGDLETVEALEAFQDQIASFEHLFELAPACIACDAHPDYISTGYAKRKALPVVSVQHHYAHVLSCMVENDLEGPVLGVSWDGTGYGSDGTVWGGEFLLVSDESFSRKAHFRLFPLPGGDRAIKEPWRVALGLLYEVFGEDLFTMNSLAPIRSASSKEFVAMKTMLRRKVNCPLTSSAGRLFDAVASIIGIRHKTRFEGQAAMQLEYALDGVASDEHYDFEWDIAGKRQDPFPVGVDWSGLVYGILADLKKGDPAGTISARFHNSLVEIIVRVAQWVGQERVVLSGGCFQNKYLTERAIDRLKRSGFRPYWHQRIPPNDGGIALGQVVAAQRLCGKE
jgi:hydrogenase maturation protein HypF